MVARRASLTIAAAVLTVSCSLQSFLPPPSPTEAPFCAPFEAAGLGSVHLDYQISPLTEPAVSATAAETTARIAIGGDKGTTCFVRLAKYDNLADHRPLVCVVQFDGLAIEALGGSVLFHGTPPPPRFLRRALVVVTTETPPAIIISAMTAP